MVLTANDESLLVHQLIPSRRILGMQLLMACTLCSSTNDFSVQGLLDQSSKSVNQPNIGIKRMGDIDTKPFQITCKQRFSPDEAMIQASTLCSLWQDNLTDPNWHPFKVVTIDGDSQVTEHVF